MRSLKAPFRVIQGSTASGKTHGIVPIVIDEAAKCVYKGDNKITLVAESVPAVKGGVVEIFKQVMQETNRWVEDRWLGSPMQYHIR